MSTEKTLGRETLEALGDKVADISKCNATALESVQSRLGKDVVCGYAYTLDVDATKDGGDWTLSAIPSTDMVSRAVNAWEFKGDPLEKVDDIFNDNIDYTLTNLDDVIRLNDVLRKVGTKYADLFADRPRTRATLKSFIKNLNIVTGATQELHALTTDIENKKESKQLKDNMDALLSAFEAITKELPGTKLKMSTREFVGFSSGSEPEPAPAPAPEPAPSPAAAPAPAPEPAPAPAPVEPPAPEPVPVTVVAPAAEPTPASDEKSRELPMAPVEPPIPDPEVEVPPPPVAGDASMGGTSVKTEMNSLVTFSRPGEISSQGKMKGVTHTSSVRDIVYLEYKGHPHLASCSYDRTIKVWQLPGYLAVKTLKGHKSNINALVTYTLDGNTLLASGSTDKCIKLWNLSTNNVVTMKGHTGDVRSLTVFYQGESPMLASGSSDMTVRVWDLTTHTLTRTLKGHSSFVYALGSFNLNGKVHLASGSNDNTIRIWNLSEKVVVTLKGHENYIWKIVIFNNNGTDFLASGSADGTVKLWNLKKKKLAYTLSGHSGCVNALTLFRHKDTPCLASADSIGVIRLWNLKTTEMLGSFNPFHTAVTALTTYYYEGQPHLAVGHYQDIELWAE